VDGLVQQHSYFLDSPRLVSDMRQALAGKAADEIDGRKYFKESNRYRLL
jgi:hypothetical protein